MSDKVVYGLTKEGFKRKRLPEIVSNMFDRFEDKAGLKVNRDADSVIGTMFHVIGYELADVWRGCEDTYNAMYPHTAEGVSLNNSAMLAGIIPKSASATQVYITCYGKEGTQITKGSIVASNSNGDITYSATDDRQISLSNANHVTIRVTKAVTAGQSYTLRVNSSSSTYVSKNGDTENTVLLNLYTKLNIPSVQFDLNDKGLFITNKDLSIGMTILLSSSLQVETIASPILFECNTDGPINPIIGDVTSIITTIDGWSSCINESKAVIGRNNESDNDLRLNWNSSLYRRGSANIDAIQGNLLNSLQDITSCRVFENVSDTVDEDGRAPHSIEVVINGGNDIDIAKEIWRLKGGGIKTNGTISVEIADSQGTLQTVRFNRPKPVKVWLKVVIEKLPEEEWSNSNRSKTVQAILNRANTLDLGQDVVLQRFVGDIYKSTTGVGLITIEASTGDSPVTYTDNNISIGVREIAEFAEDRIEVIEHV